MKSSELNLVVQRQCKLKFLNTLSTLRNCPVLGIGIATNCVFAQLQHEVSDCVLILIYLNFAPFLFVFTVSVC